MPILEIDVVARPGEELANDLAERLADAAAGVMSDAIGRTWVRLRRLDAKSYSEDAGGPPEGVYPVFVSVLQADLPGLEELKAEAARLAKAIAEQSERPVENVHILYEPRGRGRVAFGGNLLQDEG